MTPVDTPTTSEVVPNGLSNEDFKLGRVNWFGFTVLGFLVLVLTVMIIQIENKTIGNLKILADYESTAHNLARSERESLMFVVSFERWLSGSITLRDLQIRRAFLARRLEVSDNEGISSGTRISVGYFKELRALDDYMEVALPGFLPPDDRTGLRAKSESALKNFVFETSKLGSIVLMGSDERIRQLVHIANSNRAYSYGAVLVVLTLIFTVAGFLLVVRLRYFRKIHFLIEHERQINGETDAMLRRVDGELQMRIEKDLTERERQQWVDAATRSISLQVKSTVIPDKIAETVVEGLGRELGVDIVLFYSFPNFPMPRLWKQWHRSTDVLIEESLIIENETGLMKLSESLWNKKRSIIVNDSDEVNVPHDLIPKITATARERTRSWAMVPFGAGSQVMGCVGVGMAEEVRVWSSSELELIKQVVADVVHVFMHAQMFGQTMQIAENEATVGRLIELDKVKNDFIENMNHELRTPLTSIIGYMEMIIGDVDSGLEPDLAASLSVVQRNALRLQILIDNLSQISKEDFERVPLVISTVDIGHMLGDAIKSMELGADDSGVGLTLRLDSPADDLLIDGDVNQLERVFVNLLSNAVKFTPRGGKVTVVASRVHTDGSDFVEVAVTDTGIGIPPEEFPNVFKRFFRASTATQSSIPGIGIGLSLAHLIVGEHHGTITFDSTVGKGTVFTVRLPTRYVTIKPTDGTT